MHDNKNIANIDEQFTDLGWEKMHGILENEMPVAPVRKRRWGWLWLLILLPAFFVFGIMVYFGIAVWQDEKRYDNIEKINQPVAVDVIENINDVTIFEENKEAKPPRTDDFSRRSESSALTAEVVSTNSPKNIIQKEVEKNIYENNLHIIKENNFTGKIPRTDDFSRRGASDLTAKVVSTEVADAPVISEKEQTKSTSTSTAAPIKNQAQKSLFTTSRIASLSPQISSNNKTLPQTPPSFDPSPKVRKKAYTYSAFAGVRSDEFSRFGGVNMGLLAHYRFTPKVGLETGLMYANTRKNIRANIDYTNTVNELYPDNTLQYRSDIKDLHNYNYFRLPLSLNYRPHNKIQLAIGLSMGYRFDNIVGNLNTQEDLALFSPQSEQEASNYESEVDISVNIDTTASLDGEFTQITVPYSLAVRRIDAAAQAGLRYYPTPRLGIDLNYQYGLLNMTPNTTVNRNSGIRLALVWQFHR